MPSGTNTDGIISWAGTKRPAYKAVRLTLWNSRLK